MKTLSTAIKLCMALSDDLRRMAGDLASLRQEFQELIAALKNGSSNGPSA